MLLATITRDITVEKKYLNLPVANGAPKKWIRVMRGEEILREFDIELAKDDGDIDFWVTLDLEPFDGESLTIWGDLFPGDSKALDKLVQADTLIGGEDVYKEKYRPQFHFTSKRGWNNDPDGMMFYDGEFHLFYQHNPYGWNWGNMTWGHAVSKDLVHWTELGDAIHPDELGTIFSGGGAVDWNNTGGFQTGDEPPLICFYTYAGGENLSSEGKEYTQAIAYSNDRGRTFTKYEGNPVLSHVAGHNRDPKVLWYEPNQEWVMVLYMDENRFGFFTSKDLKTWKLESELDCFSECPELFELPVDGDKANTRWVLYGAAGDYFVGSFNGKDFAPDGEAIKFNYGDCFYASQTFSDVPEEDGRRIQIAWGQTGHPDMPFNQQMNFPVELTLRTTKDGVRMFAEPVVEIEKLHRKTHTWSDLLVSWSSPVAIEVPGDLFHVKAALEVKEAGRIMFVFGDTSIAYNTTKQELQSKEKTAKLAPVDGVVVLEMLVDRLSIEAFGNGGQVYMPMTARTLDGLNAILCEAGTMKIQSLEIIELESAWK